jgi:arylsulfatase
LVELEKKIENSGQLSKERMETVDEELLLTILMFAKQKMMINHFYLVKYHRMHMYTHQNQKVVIWHYLIPEHDMYGSGMMEHDMQVGMILAELEKNGRIRKYNYCIIH